MFEMVQCRTRALRLSTRFFLPRLIRYSDSFNKAFTHENSVTTETEPNSSRAQHVEPPKAPPVPGLFPPVLLAHLQLCVQVPGASQHHRDIVLVRGDGGFSEHLLLSNNRVAILARFHGVSAV